MIEISETFIWMFGAVLALTFGLVLGAMKTSKLFYKKQGRLMIKNPWWMPLVSFGILFGLVMVMFFGLG